MIREIKFRGKRIDNGEWVYGSLLQSEIDVNEIAVECQIHERFAHDFSIAVHDVIPETVGQFTGLTDKNGKDIYEGDIIADSERSYEIRFGEFEYDLSEIIGFYLYDDETVCLPIGKNDEHMIQVIGNIYETIKENEK